MRSLDVADMADRSGDERLLFGTLRGVVNRERPRVYLIEDADEGKEAWPSTFTVPQLRVQDPWTLVERYRDDLRGVVVYRRTATPNDHLLAGPTGAGYVFPQPYPDDSFRDFARVSGMYMREADLTSLYGLNREDGTDAALSAADARAVVDHMRPEGVVLNLFFDRNVQHGLLPRGTPLTTGPIATTVEQGRAQVRDAIAGCAGRRPCFVTLGVLSWSMGPTQLAEIAASLGDDVVVVRGDHYFELMREAR